MTLWRWAALASLAFIAIALSFGRIAGIDACGGAADPIFVFEMVRTPQDVASLFPDACRAVHAAAQRDALWLDIIAFVPVYSGFLILGLLALRREGSAAALRYASWGITMVIAAALFDQWENSRLLAILAALPGDQAMIDQLILAPRIKFVLLGVVVAMIGVLHAVQPGWRKVAGSAIALGGTVSAIGVVANHGWVMSGSAIGWLALILTTWALALRKAAPA